MRSNSSSLALLALVLLGGAVPAGGAGPPQAEEEAAFRTFLVETGEPGLPVDVNGHEYVTDDRGTLRLTMRASAGETLRFRSRDPAWALDEVRTVPVEDPSVPVLWDLTSELRRAPPERPPLEERFVTESPAAEEEATATAPEPPAVAPDPCRGGGSLRCRQAKWARFERAMARRDCDAALADVDELVVEYPELATAGDSVAAFAKAYLDCGLVRFDESLIRRSITVASSYRGGELWCGPESRLLARAFEALGDTAAAADSAAAAQESCEASATGALEWEFYFRFRRGERERCAALAEQSPRRLGLFLRAWLELARGQCAAEEVELEPSGDLPCRGLPQEFCSRQYGRLLIACGEEPEDYQAAARYLRAALPLDPAVWTDLLTGEERQLVAELAEAETLAGDHAAAVDLYRRLVDNAPETDDGQQATLWRLYGDALFSAAESDEGRRDAVSAYERARRDLAPDSVDFAIVTNNLCVLRDKLAKSMDGEELARDLADLETALDDAVPADERRLRLWLKHNLLSVRIHLLERETDLDAQEKLKRLEELRLPFAEYRREVEALAAGAPGPPSGSLEKYEYQGRRFVIAVP